MPQPSDPLVAVMVQRLDANLREAFEERAAIVEFDAGLPRAHAECLALLGVLRGHPAVLSGLCVLQFHRDGAVHHLITTEPALARKHLADTGAVRDGRAGCGGIRRRALSRPGPAVARAVKAGRFPLRRFFHLI